MIVTLLSDYGRDDEFVGVCHGVIAGIAPDMRVIDITHGIPRFDVRRGALALCEALPFMPVGVHVAVVDPQVGTERRAIAVRCQDGRVLVGPDNGLLSLAWEQAGGVDLAVDITRSTHRLEPVSATFHGRDLFAPVAAHLSAGAAVEDAGSPLEPDSPQRLELPEPFTEGDTLVAHVLSIDGYGNVALNVDHARLAGSGLTLGAAISLTTPRGTSTAPLVTTFADVEPGALIVYEDASRMLALAVNRGSAARTLGLEPDTEVRLRRR